MRTILVTGAAGFIGSNFVRLVLSREKDVKLVAYDKLTYAGNLANLQDLLSDARLASRLVTSQLPSAHSTCGTWTTPVCRAARRMFASLNGSRRYGTPFARSRTICPC